MLKPFPDDQYQCYRRHLFLGLILWMFLRKCEPLYLHWLFCYQWFSFVQCPLHFLIVVWVLLVCNIILLHRNLPSEPKEHRLFCYQCFSVVQCPLSNCIVCSATPLSVPGYRCFTVSDGSHTWRHRSKIVQGQRSEHCQSKNSKKKYKYEIKIHTDNTNTNHMTEIC